MSDPLRTDAQRALEASPPDVGREAKIEQLLLTGLEHYFALQYDQAINVWTRALFLDRTHARARAYIERARSAQAELQRESEELLQRGFEAFRQGEGDEARRLLHDALEQGAPSDEALVVLDRLNRLAHVPPPAGGAPAGSAHPLPAAVEFTPRTSRRAWVALGLLTLVIAGAGAFAAGAFRSDWRPLLTRPSALFPVASRPATGLALSLPRRGETALMRAQSFYQGGRLRDALNALEAVRATDEERPQADRLRAEIQKRLIDLEAGSLGTPRRGADAAAQP